MPPEIHWQQIALRLALTLIAGSLLGAERSRSGHFAGLRTTLLVTLAASVSMIQMNLLIQTNGKPQDSYAVMDLMRLPLGILTGMGFIGGGAILRRDGFVLGVTTAATLWFVTVVGLCFGGGQITLGIAAFALGILVLEGLRWFDYRVKQEQHGTLTLTTERDEPRQEAIRTIAHNAGYKTSVASVAFVNQAQQRQIELRLQWRGIPQNLDAPPFLRELASDPHVLAAQWKVS